MPVLGGGGDPSPVGSGDGCGNGEPQPIASGLGVAGAVGAVEPVKQMGKMFPFHHRTGIVHREVQVFPLTPQLQRNGAAGFGVFQGVVQQDGEKLDVYKRQPGHFPYIWRSVHG